MNVHLCHYITENKKRRGDVCCSEQLVTRKLFRHVSSLSLWQDLCSSLQRLTTFELWLCCIRFQNNIWREGERELSLNLPFSLHCARVFVTVRQSQSFTKSKSLSLLKSHTPLSLCNPLRAVCGGAKCLVRSDVSLVYSCNIPIAHKVWITQLHSTFLHFKAKALIRTRRRKRFMKMSKETSTYANHGHMSSECPDQKCKHLLISALQFCVH